MLKARLSFRTHQPIKKAGTTNGAGLLKPCFATKVKTRWGNNAAAPIAATASAFGRTRHPAKLFFHARAIHPLVFLWLRTSVSFLHARGASFDLPGLRTSWWTSLLSAILCQGGKSCQWPMAGKFVGNWP